VAQGGTQWRPPAFLVHNCQVSRILLSLELLRSFCLGEKWSLGYLQNIFQGVKHARTAVHFCKWQMGGEFVSNLSPLPHVLCFRRGEQSLFLLFSVKQAYAQGTRGPQSCCSCVLFLFERRCCLLVLGSMLGWLTWSCEDSILSAALNPNSALLRKQSGGQPALE
jgi:hypothetical protein